ncbi:MAG: hypothetical protein IPJ19_00840 [Planctomycetes bacterium]|nr:hypothetical protein [Planctomycetota bacterium]
MKPRRRIEGWFSLAVLVAVLGLALVAQSLRDKPHGESHSVTSAEGDGRRGYFLLLQELGFQPLEWRSAPGKLPRGENLLWLPRRPEPWRPREETEPGPDQPNLLPGHALSNYRNFVADGGTLVAAASDTLLEFLKEELGIAAVDEVSLRAQGERSKHSVRLESGEQLALELDERGLMHPFPAHSPWRELWIVENEESEHGPEDLAAAEIPYGAGRVVLLADDSFLDNDELRKEQNALAGVRLVEQLARGGRLYFDEYALGTWEPESALSLSASPQVFLFSAHALALLVLFLWARAYARAFPRDPPPRARASPLERAEALARLWKSSGRTRLAAQALRAAAQRWSGPRSAAAELEALAIELERKGKGRGARG